MSPEPSHNRAAAVAGTLGAGAMIAQQVAGKATRDALFLSHFPVEVLPYIVVATAILAVVAMAAMVRLLTRFGPARVVPKAFAASGVMLAAIAAAAETSGRVAAVLLYLHIGAIGAVLISGFWSVVNERFDPRAARRTVGRIAVGGTVGGLAGGLLAMGVARSASFSSVLLVLAALHFACIPLVRRMRMPRSHAPTRPLDDREGSIRRGLRTIGGDRYLLGVAAIVLMATSAEALIDWVFKAEAQAHLGDGAALLRFFALFYTGVGALTFAFQVGAGRRLLERFGTLPAVASLPVAVAVATGGAFAVPSLLSAALARGTDAVVRSSLYRSGYELLYVPVQPETKRTVKTVIDVGLDRFGNVLGGIAVTAVLALGVAAQTRILLGVAIALSVGGVLAAMSLRRGYTNALEASMVHRAIELELSGASDDEEFRSTLLLTLGELDLDRVLKDHAHELERAERQAPEPSEDGDAAPDTADPVLDGLRVLRSADAARINELLSRPLSPELAPHVVPLLGWDEVAARAILALRPLADTITGQLVDALVNPASEFAVRRRVPRVLSACRSQRAVDGLMRGLHDERFEVRAQSGRALRRVLRRDDTLEFDGARILDAVAREVSVDRAVWESHRLIDDESGVFDEPDADDSPFVIDAIRVRSERALQHVFRMLSLVHSEDALQTAYRALHTDDAHLRGTAVEYLESVLPARIHRGLLPFIEDRPRSPAPARPREEVLRALLRSNKSIQMNLEALRGRQVSDDE